MSGILFLLFQAAWNPAAGPQPGSNAWDGDPIDLATGLYENVSTDFENVTRTYRTLDARSRAFGIGANHAYDVFLVGDSTNFTWIDLINPDGGRYHYVRTSPGTGYVDAELIHNSTPTMFFHSKLRWNRQWGGWDLTLVNGTIYQFPASAHAVRSSQGAAISVRGPDGSGVKIDRNDDGDILRIVASNGRRLDFTYDTAHRVTEAKDDRGRSASYRYDERGRLVFAKLPTGQTLRYTYDVYHRMLTVEKDGKLFLTNTYDHAGRAVRQDVASGFFLLTYTEDPNGRIVQTEVRNPGGQRRRVVFNAERYIINDTRNLGTADEETILYELEPGSNRVLNWRIVRPEPL